MENNNKFRGIVLPVIIGIVSGLIVLGIGFFLLPKLSNNKKDNNPTPTPSVEPTATIEPTLEPTSETTPTTTSKGTTKPTATPKITSIDIKSTDYTCGVGKSIIIKVSQCGENVKSMTANNSNISIKDLGTGEKNGNCLLHTYSVSCEKMGDSVITAKGDKLKTDTASVKVLSNYTAPETITLSTTFNKQTVRKGDIYRVLSKITPGNASIKNIVWSSSNTKIVDIDQTGKITAVAGGKATIKATIYLDDEKTISDSIDLYVIDTSGKDTEISTEPKLYYDPTAIDCSVGKKEEVLLYSPNVKDRSTIKLVTKSETIATIEKHPNKQVKCIDCTLYQITCKKKGATTIEATTESGLSAILTVKVQ